MTETENLKESWIVKSFIDYINTKGEFDTTHTTVKEGTFTKTTFTDQATQLLFETYVAGRKAANTDVGHFIIGKFIGSSKLQFSSKPYIHPTKKSVVTEVKRLLELQPKDVFVMYQSIGIYKAHEQTNGTEQTN